MITRRRAKEIETAKIYPRNVSPREKAKKLIRNKKPEKLTTKNEQCTTKVSVCISPLKWRQQQCTTKVSVCISPLKWPKFTKEQSTTKIPSQTKVITTNDIIKNHLPIYKSKIMDSETTDSDNIYEFLPTRSPPTKTDKLNKIVLDDLNRKGKIKMVKKVHHTMKKVNINKPWSNNDVKKAIAISTKKKANDHDEGAQPYSLINTKSQFDTIREINKPAISKKIPQATRVKKNAVATKLKNKITVKAIVHAEQETLDFEDLSDNIPEINEPGISKKIPTATRVEENTAVKKFKNKMILKEIVHAEPQSLPNSPIPGFEELLNISDSHSEYDNLNNENINPLNSKTSTPALQLRNPSRSPLKPILNISNSVYNTPKAIPLRDKVLISQTKIQQYNTEINVPVTTTNYKNAENLEVSDYFGFLSDLPEHDSNEKNANITSNKNNLIIKLQKLKENFKNKPKSNAVNQLLGSHNNHEATIVFSNDLLSSTKIQSTIPKLLPRKLNKTPEKLKNNIHNEIDYNAVKVKQKENLEIIDLVESPIITPHKKYKNSRKLPVKPKPKSPTKKRKMDKKTEIEFNSFVEEFNSMCEEVENYHLIIE